MPDPVPEHSSDVDHPARSRPPLRERLAPMIAVAASFLLHAAIRAPIPGPNEPHYLAKAKHYWNPEWCEGDFFLESANTHRVFYETFGPATLLLSLPLVAVLGRLFAYSVLAVGWTEFVNRVAQGRWTPLFSAWLFLGLASIGNLSGEWMVGGVEAKVFGYGYVLLGLAWAIDRRWIASFVTIGFAVAWHPLVGLWSVAAALFATVVVAAGGSRSSADEATPLSWRRIALATLLAIPCMLPGILPALDLFGSGDTRDPNTAWYEPVDDVRIAADYIQSAYRLSHHLDPMRFPLWAWPAYLGLVVVAWVLRPANPRPGERFLLWFVVGTLAIAALGVVVGWRTPTGWEWLGGKPVFVAPGLGELPYDDMSWRVGLLKFYWFRVADIVVPLAYAIVVCDALQRRLTGATRVRAVVLVTTFWAATLCFPGADGRVTALTAREQAAWDDVCDWIRENTPPDARFRTPDSAIDFKWRTGRAEFLSIKDCPQDASGIVEWNDRLRYVAGWASDHYDDERYDERELRDLARTLDVDYFIAWHLGPIELDPVFERGPFRVYDLRDRDASVR